MQRGLAPFPCLVVSLAPAGRTRDRVTLVHTDQSETARFVVPTATSLSPGDTVLVGEHWF
jgi:hypothetical protein